jgi:hypothetical protein
LERKEIRARRGTIKENGRHPVDEMACSKDGITPKKFGYTRIKQESSDNIKQVLVPVLNNSIL